MGKQTADVQVVPRHLKAATGRWFEQVVRDYQLEQHHLRLLQTAAESWDRAQAARQIIAKEGLIVRDPRGHLRPHPAIKIERESKTLFIRAVRELGLDLAGPDEPPRPGGLTGRCKQR